MNSNLDRRAFLKGAGLVGLTAAGLGASLSGCSPSTSTSGSGSSNSDVAAGGGEAAGAGGDWGVFDENGVLTPKFLIAPDSISESDIVENFEADVVVIGFGLAGICAARSALENGASVFVVEKSDTYHLHSHQISAINSQIYKNAGLEMSREMMNYIISQETQTYRERTDSTIWKYMIEHCGEDFDWYLSLCPSYVVVNPLELAGETNLDYKAILNICTSGLAGPAGRHFDDVTSEREEAARSAGPYINLFNYPLNPNWDYKSERWPMFPGTIAIEPDQTQVGIYSAEYVENNATVKYACWAQQLLTDNTGRVIGVDFVDIDDKCYRVKAGNGVIIATGSYGGNKQMVDYYNRTGSLFPDPGWVDTDAKGQFTDMGEGLSMAAWAGAAIDPQDTHTFVSDSMGGSLGCDAFLLVDGDGHRFMNEDVTGEILGHKNVRVAKNKMFQIFDDDYPQYVGTMPIGHRCIWKIVDTVEEIPLGLFFDPIGMMTRQEVETMTTYICDTIGELAEKMEVDATTLKETIDRYNELYDIGTDEDFGKRADRLQPIRTAPFYATEITPPVARLYYGGIRIDENMKALNTTNYQSMEGLYVAGSCIGNRFHGCYPNILMGQNHAGCLVYGRLAGRNAALGV
ncbi:MAG: FAD-binding protein [Coriobacteriales bacterium]|jgi:succinate dehydrogenase/fumarate reductase flavoprotein subunit|nr:FAD-binding protein [Coriobacteriales bacterium]